MFKNPLLHLTLVMFVLLFVYLWVRFGIAPEIRPIGTVPVAPSIKVIAPVNQPSVPVHTRRYIFPAVTEKYRAAVPHVWGRPATEFQLKADAGPVPKPHPGQLPEKQIAPAPQQIKLPWIFALP